MTLNLFNDNILYPQMGYIGIFFWFAFLDQFVPVPEEIMLLSIGYLSGQHLLNPFWAGLTAFLGLMVIDNFFYLLSRSGSKLIEKLRNKLSKKIVQRYEGRLKNKSVSTLLLLSFIPKIRFFSPILAGLFRISWQKFFIVNGAGTLIFTSAYIAAGLLFHKSLVHLIQEVEIWRHSIFVLTMVVLASIIIMMLRRKNEAKKNTSENAG